MKSWKHLTDSWIRHFSLHLTTTLVVSSCFGILFSGLVVASNFQKMLSLWGDDIQMVVYLKEDVSDQEVFDLNSKIKEIKNVGKVEFISQTKALADFKAQMASYAPDISKDDELLTLIPASFQVSLSHTVNSENQDQEMQKIAGQIREMPIVEEVSYGQEWAKKYSELVGISNLVFLALGLVILLASMFVISNVVRASIANRSREIEILELIGATARMIRRPYLLEGASLGAISATVAVLGTAMLAISLQQLLLAKLKFLKFAEHLQFASVGLIAGFICFGAMLGWLAAYLCVRKINSGWSAAKRLEAQI